MDIRELALLVEEVSDGYASKFGIQRDTNWFLLKLQEELGEVTQACLMKLGKARGKGFSEDEMEAAIRGELADLTCHALLLARHLGIDLEDAISEKWLVWR